MPTCLCLVLLSIVSLAISSAAFAQNVPTQLELKNPQVRTLSGGDSHRYRLEAEAGAFLHVVAEQKGIDIVLSLSDAQGSRLIEVDGPNGSRGPEPLWFVIEKAGTYAIEVRSLEVEAKPGEYSLELLVQRPASEDDRSYATGRQIVAEAVTIANTAKDPDTAKILAKLDSAAGHFEKISGQADEKATGFVELARRYRAHGQFERSMQYFDQAIGIFERIGAKRNLLWAINTSLSSQLPQHETIRRNQRVLGLAQELGDATAEVNALVELGIAYFFQGHFEKAQEVNLRSLDLAQKINFEARLPRIYDNLGNVYSATGNQAAALESHQKALDLYRSQNAVRNIPSTTLNIGNAYFRAGNYELALDSFQRALTDFEKYRNRIGIAYATSNIGSVYLETENYEKALEWFQKAQVLKVQLFPDDHGSYYNIGSAYRGLKRMKEAQEQFEKSLEICRRIEDYQCESSALTAISNLNWDLRDYKNALVAAEKAVEIALKYNARPELVRAYGSLANAHLGLGRREEAKRVLQTSIEIVDALRKEVTDDPVARRLYFDRHSEPHKHLISLEIEGGSFENALTLAETIKARALLDSLSTGNLDISSAMSEKERSEEKALRSELLSLFSRRDESGGPELKDVEEQIRRKQLELEGFRIRLYAAHPELKVDRADFAAINKSDIETLVAQQGDLVLEFDVDRDSVSSFLILKGRSGNSHTIAETRSIDRGELEGKIETFRSKAASGDLGFQAASKELYELLIKPFEKELAGKTNIIIVPDGPLWDLPFQALMDEKGKYLVEKAAISYAPSLTALREMKKRAQTRKPSPDAELLAFGNPIVGSETKERVQRVFMSEKLEPIPEAGRLVNELGKMYGPTRSKIFTGNAAREEVAKTEAPKYRIVQFATHGILNNVSPMYSHLVMSQDAKNPNEDGLLEAWELKDLDLKADMLILTACETARGKISSGEGVIGMTWAAFIAGAPTTVATQWKVESSSTTELMLEFHRQLLGKKKISKAEALRRASLKVMKMPQFRHPSYWAGFVMVGDGS